MAEPTNAQRETMDHVLAQNPGSTWTIARTVAPNPAVLVRYPEGAMFRGVNIQADGTVHSAGFSSYPAGRAAQYQHMVARGSIDPDCPACRAIHGTAADPNPGGFGPSHTPSPSCQSGSRPHCTCDTCF